VAKSGVDVRDIAAVGIANQRETTIVWEKATGRPVYNAIVWQCRRTAEIVDALIAADTTPTSARRRASCRTPILGPKIQWILDNVPGARVKPSGASCCSARWTRGHVEADERPRPRDRPHERQPDDAVQYPHAPVGRRASAAHEHPARDAPAVRESSFIYGHVPIQDVFVPIAGVAGDQQAALFGQTCFSQAKRKTPTARAASC
jgi:glycerol kinase